MSDTILAFAAPLLDDPLSEKEFRDAIGLAVIAWNMSYLPDDEWREALHTDDIPAHEADQIEDMLAEMVALRRLVFSGDDRLVVEFEASFRSEQPHLQVAWTRVEGPAPTPRRRRHAAPRSEQLELDFA